MSEANIHIGIDVGGTFTDVAVSIPSRGRLLTHKLPSTPNRPDRAIMAGIADVLSEHGLDASDVARLHHGTTIGTNALIQRRCGKVAVVTTEGFRDLLEIGRQIRPKVYDIHTDFPPPLVPRDLRFEVKERMRADGVVHVPLAEQELESIAAELRAVDVDCVVVCFINAYAYPTHERHAAEILRRAMPEGVPVVASSEVFSEFREYERFSTAVLNGALLTVIRDYAERLASGVSERGIGADLKVSQSAGGLMSLAMARRLPIRTALSGPAAGVIGAAARAQAAGFPDVITLDVGGTSSDVSLLRDGTPSEVQDRSLAGFPLRVPALDVNAIGAGGGSIAWIDVDGLLKVGPQSAGAAPGPACYDQGGKEATVTDANVLIGRLNGDALLDGRMPINARLAEQSVADLAARLGLDLYETALGIIRIACANIVRAIRTISLERGHNPAAFSLFAFGGAGPLHAADVARDLAIERIIVPPDPGILCADGLLHSDLRADFVTSILKPLEVSATEAVESARAELRAAAARWFNSEHVSTDRQRVIWTADLRYKGQNHELAVPVADRTFDSGACHEINRAFEAAHTQAYGFAPEDEPVEFVNLRIQGIGVLEKPAFPELPSRAASQPSTYRRVLFSAENWVETPVYKRTVLAPEQRIDGPAIVEQLDATVPVHPGDRCVVDRWGNLIISLNRG